MSLKSRCSLLIISLVLIVIFASVFQFAQLLTTAQEKLTTTTVASDKFVKGGKLETTSDEKLKTHSEMWVDDKGKILERHEYIYDEKGKLIRERWNFPARDPCEKSRYSPGGGTPAPEGKWYLECGTQRWKNVTDEGVAAEINTIEEKIKVRLGSKPADTGDKPAPEEKPKDETKKQDPPKEMDPGKPGYDATEPPRLTNDPPKSENTKPDKTSTGDSGGNTASTSLPSGYKLNTNDVAGLDSWTLTTPYGGWRLNFPADVQPGEPFTGTIFLDPTGKNDSERAKNLSKLEEHKLAVGDQVVSQAKWPGNNLYSVGLGKTVLRGGYRMLYDPPFYNIYMPVRPHTDLPPPPTEFRIPTGGQQSGLFIIPGPFDGTLSPTDFVKINGELIPIISESPRSRVVWNTSGNLGQANIEISENGQTGQCPFHNVRVSLSTNAPIRLLRGQTATVTVTFSGLGKLNQDVPYDLVNHSPTVVSMQGAQEAQNRMIPYTMIVDPNGAQGGTYTDHVTITGVAAGAFLITAAVQWKETCNLPPNAMHKE